MPHSFGLHSLNDDVAHLILSHLSPYDLSSLAATSTLCNSFASRDLLWQPKAPASPGKARHTYLRAVAWRAARADRCVSLQLTSAPVHQLHLVPNGLFSASLQPCQPLLTQQSAYASVFTPPFKPQSSPIAVAMSTHPSNKLSYLAYAYPCSSVRLLSICHSTHIAKPHSVTRLPISPAQLTSVHILPTVHNNETSHQTCPLLIAGTSQGQVLITRVSTTTTTTTTNTPSSSSCSKLSISPCAITALSAQDQTVLVGTAGGELYTVDLPTLQQKQLFIGPCPCPVTSVSANESTLVAGIKHSVPGNGHTCAAVAWCTSSTARLAAFGRGALNRSSSALPPAATQAVVTGAERVALLVGGRARVYEMADWRCTVDVGVSDGMALDMDDSRLAVATDSGHIQVLDFERAVKRWPQQVTQFSPHEESRHVRTGAGRR
ncbi:hypothetical protein BWQ96_09350 [Gracilariopsis chorda]|uniref:F-box domain-containing protein n=1 Tax=Gracilariopsis chorda TaxID=448386 RepID=A0A2V3IFU3_9FLOR|nr:hypothetical protein BWQ96_09350 [Gracilariopsis chorda]|eukprot:PXF40955.1 hypothetical protein BWQ96_09350 [Gracilariopsis chorda]